MQTAPIPDNEQERQAAVDRMRLAGSAPEERFSKITREAAEAFAAPISTISVVDRGREWYKAGTGIVETEGPRETSFCGHTIGQEKIFIVEDATKDERFKDNPQVIGPPHVRFYAGVTMHDYKTRQPIGAFCVKDTKPRSLSIKEISTLLEYAHRAENELNIDTTGRLV